MEISISTVEHIANLARLNLSEDEKLALTAQLRDIVSYVEQLNELNTDDAQPTAHVLPISNVFREDIVTNSDNRDQLLANAPASSDGCIEVPKVVE